MLKVSTKTHRVNQQQVTGESPSKAQSHSISINIGALKQGSGETSNRDTTKIFRRQAGAIKLKDLREKVGPQELGEQ